jgi:glycosyltransferase involved in cell wall biosynthesis
MKISIITVCFNAAHILPGCLSSVARQTYRDIEHIIVDGASTDGTAALVGQYPHVSRFVSAADKGIYDAMNKGIGLSTGEFILFLNADDTFASDKALENAIKAIEADPGGDVYYGWLEVRPLNGAPFVHRPLSPEHGPELMVTGCLPHQSTIARKSTFNKTGLFDLQYRYHADYDWFIKILADPGIIVKAIPCPIGSFKEGGASSQLDKGQSEVFQIQARTPLYASTAWDKKRIALLQEAWLAARIEVAQLRSALDQARDQLEGLGAQLPATKPNLRLRSRVARYLSPSAREAVARVRAWLGAK